MAIFFFNILQGLEEFKKFFLRLIVPETMEKLDSVFPGSGHHDFDKEDLCFIRKQAFFSSVQNVVPKIVKKLMDESVFD